MPTTYMICGTLAVFMNLAGYYRSRPAPVQPLNHLLVQRLGFSSLALLGAFFVFVRVFARFD